MHFEEGNVTFRNRMVLKNSIKQARRILDRKQYLMNKILLLHVLYFADVKIAHIINCFYYYYYYKERILQAIPIYLQYMWVQLK